MLEAPAECDRFDLGGMRTSMEPMIGWGSKKTYPH